MIRAATFWFLSVWTAFLASLDIVFIAYGVEAVKYAFFLLLVVVFQMMVIRRWGPKEEQAS